MHADLEKSEGEKPARLGDEVKIAVLTSVDIRHRYFANAMRAALDVVAVVHEEVGYAPVEVGTCGLTDEEKRTVEDHFRERTRQEKIFFGGAADFVDDADERYRVLHLTPHRLNTTDTLDFLEAGSPDRPRGPAAEPVDTLVVFGTNLIKEPLLRRYAGRIINLHLGLSPYYRGTATNFYPLLNEEPEYVGATVHLIDAGIDSGPILAHARPEIVAGDMPHTIGCKAILAGINKLILVLKDLQQGAIEAVPQWDVPNPRLCLRKGYHPRQVVALYRKIELGLIRDYVKRAPRVAGQVRLIE